MRGRSTCRTGDVRHRLLPVILLLLAATPAAAAEVPPDLATVLRDLGRDRPLEIHLDDGGVLTGWRGSVTADSLFLVKPHVACALAEVVLVRRQDSGARRGFGIGGAVGAAGGAVFGLLAGMFLAYYPEADDDFRDATAVVGSTVLFAGVAMVAGGLVGAGAGSLGKAWYDVWPRDRTRPRPPPPPRGARLGVRAGLSGMDDLAGRSYESGYLGVALLQRGKGWFELAGELGWFNLGMNVQARDGEPVRIDDTVLAGAALRVGQPRTGIAPFLSAGLGYYVRNDGWLGYNLGVGLRWRTASGRDLDAEIRLHSGTWGADNEPTSGMVSVAAGWTFRL